MRVHLTRISRNKKTGLIPVSTSTAATCPDSCAMKVACYASTGPLAMHWRKVTQGTFGVVWSDFLTLIRKLPSGTFWRHNQAGDLPGDGDVIDSGMLAELVTAQRGKKGFTYTHKPPHVGNNAAAIKGANEKGFAINLSADNLASADALADFGIGPVVVVLPSSISGNVRVETPAGRRVVVCPATYREDTTCDSCRLCAIVSRRVVVGFPSHGARFKLADEVATSA